MELGVGNLFRMAALAQGRGTLREPAVQIPDSSRLRSQNTYAILYRTDMDIDPEVGKQEALQGHIPYNYTEEKGSNGSIIEDVAPRSEGF